MLAEITLFLALALKTRFIAVRGLVQEERAMEIPDLPWFYKSFEGSQDIRRERG
jgi:hypothetical protein